MSRAYHHSLIWFIQHWSWVSVCGVICVVSVLWKHSGEGAGAGAGQRAKETRWDGEEPAGKNERRLKELLFQSEEDQKNQTACRSWLERLQMKMKAYKRQVEEAVGTLLLLTRGLCWLVLASLPVKAAWGFWSSWFDQDIPALKSSKARRTGCKTSMNQHKPAWGQHDILGFLLGL